MDSASLVSVGCGMVALAFILCLPQARGGRRCSTPHLQLPTGGPLLADSANSGHPLANGSHRRCATVISPPAEYKMWVEPECSLLARLSPKLGCFCPFASSSLLLEEAHCLSPQLHLSLVYPRPSPPGVSSFPPPRYPSPVFLQDRGIDTLSCLKFSSDPRRVHAVPDGPIPPQKWAAHRKHSTFSSIPTSSSRSFNGRFFPSSENLRAC